MKRPLILTAIIVAYLGGVLTGGRFWKNEGPPVVRDSPTKPAGSHERINVETLESDWDWTPPYTFVTVKGVIRNTNPAAISAVEIEASFKHILSDWVTEEVVRAAPAVGTESTVVSLPKPLATNEIARFDAILNAPVYFRDFKMDALLAGHHINKGRPSMALDTSRLPPRYRTRDVEGTANVLLKIEGLR